MGGEITFSCEPLIDRFDVRDRFPDVIDGSRQFDFLAMDSRDAVRLRIDAAAYRSFFFFFFFLRQGLGHFLLFRIGHDVQVALRERNRNTGLPECLVDREVEIALHGETAIDARYPDTQLEIERAVAKSHEQGARPRRAPVGNYLGMILCNGLEDLAHFFDVRAISDTDEYAQAPERIAQDPVGNTPGYQFRIRHQHVLVVQGFDFCGAYTNTSNETLDVADRHEITCPNRPFE